MITATIDGTPNRKWPTIVADVSTPIAALSACSAYIQCV